MLKDGTYIKDFSYLGRPIKEIVYLDWNDKVVPYHKENTVILPEWTGDETDRELYDILPFLESKFSLLFSPHSYVIRSCTETH